MNSVAGTMINSVVRQRSDLQFLDGATVECSGRVKEFRPHKRKDLESVLLVNLIVTPIPVGESIAIDHMWVLKKQLQKMGKIPSKNERIRFIGTVYPYKRLGGKSIDRGLYGSTDYGILPKSIL
jgi:hypothetical protein